MPIKARKPRQHPEDDLQIAVADWLRLSLPEQSIFHHSPNQAKAKRAWHIKRKRMGMQDGWPDLEIVWRGRSIFIELKAPKNYPTAKQKEVHAQLKLAGAVVTVCRTLEEVRDFLDQLMPLRRIAI